jgi:hypothetical protein
MKIGYREPAFLLVKESESPVEQNVSANGKPGLITKWAWTGR